MSEQLIAVQAANGLPAPPFSSVCATAVSRHTSLRANFSWTFAGNVIYAACQWGMLIALAKLGSRESVGQFALGLAITAPVLMLSNLQLRGVQATDARQRFRFSHYLTLRLVATSAALIVIIVIAMSASYSPDTARVIVAIGVAKAIESISDVYYGLLQRHEQMSLIAVSMIIKGILSLGAFVALLYFDGGVWTSVLGLIIVWTGVLVCYDIPRATRATGGRLKDGISVVPQWTPKELAELVRTAAPLGVVMALISFNANIPRYFIERHLGDRALGTFAAAAYLVVGGSTVIAALGQSASPRLSRHYADQDRQKFVTLLRKLVSVAVLLGACGTLIAMLAGRTILSFAYRAAYSDAANVFTWTTVAASIGFVASFFGYAITAAQRFAVQVPVNILAVAVTLLACYALVPSYGLLGASLAMVATAAVQALCGCLVVIRVVKSVSPLKGATA